MAEPIAEYCPAGQSVHEVAPELEYLPALQGIHAPPDGIYPSVEYVPAGQGPHFESIKRLTKIKMIP